MNGGVLVREARLRAGLTQRQLADRAGTTQPTVARIEGGVVNAGFETVVDLIRSCGLEFRFGLVQPDDSDWSVACSNLALDLDARVRQNASALKFINAGRKALRS